VSGARAKTGRSERRRDRLGACVARDIGAAGLPLNQAAAKMGLSKTGLHNVLHGRSRLTAAAAVRLAAVLEDAQLLAAGGRFDVARVRRRAREYLMMQAEIDLTEALGSDALAGILEQARLARRRRRRCRPAVPAAVYRTVLARGPEART